MKAAATARPWRGERYASTERRHARTAHTLRKPTASTEPKPTMLSQRVISGSLRAACMCSLMASRIGPATAPRTKCDTVGRITGELRKAMTLLMLRATSASNSREAPSAGPVKPSKESSSTVTSTCMPMRLTFCTMLSIHGPRYHEVPSPMAAARSLSMMRPSTPAT